MLKHYLRGLKYGRHKYSTNIRKRDLSLTKIDQSMCYLGHSDFDAFWSGVDYQISFKHFKRVPLKERWLQKTGYAIS